MRRLAAALSLVLAAACSTAAAEKADQPRALQGTWGRDTVTDDVTNGEYMMPVLDTLILRADGSAARHLSVKHPTRVEVGKPIDYTRWRVSVDTATHAALLCLEKAGVGNVECLPLVADSTRLQYGEAVFHRAPRSK